nr:unnamed protein product [Digitaria exilis]
MARGPRRREDGWWEMEMGRLSVAGDGEGEEVVASFEVLGWYLKRGLVVEGIEFRPAIRMSERPTSSPAPAPASLPDDKDILGQILLHLPPLPSSLPRASLVNKLWHRIISDPTFRRRFWAHHHHNTPPLLSFFFESFIDGLHRPHFPPEFNPNHEARIYLGAVLRDADDDDDLAGSMSEFKFKLVVVFYGVCEWALRVSVYESESGRWGEIISTTTYSDSFKPSVLVGNKLYWLIRHQRGCNFLQFDVDRQAMAIIKMSDDVMHVPDGAHVQAMAIIGGLGFAIVWRRRMQLWGKTSISGNVVRGVLEKAVELDQLLPMKPALTAMERQPSIVGYDEEKWRTM